jgi:tRNA dimethylallyltransferase
MSEASPPITLITGPTASGKSAYAMTLARKTGAEIVGADSMQLYAGLQILTAGPTPEEEVGVPHHVVGIADPASGWSVGRWLEEATKALAAIAARGKPALIVGGTGLYFRALTHGLADIPQVSRAESELAYDKMGEDKFRRILREFDPKAEARIERADRQRLVRAHAVGFHTGRALSDYHEATKPALAPGSWTALVLEPPREEIYARCDARVPVLVENGALDEVKALMARNLDPALPAMKAVGVGPFAEHLRGAITLDQAIAAVQQETRHYAKRQLTWLRNQVGDWPRLETLAAP